ncbi:MAG: TIGR02757 family protein [Williamsia sp.]|nr:TIGR02757 family protein [Williamsia sp.]
MANQHLIDFLNKKADEFNRPAFIADDPVSIPHRFTKKQDIEIAGFFAALFAWGNRTTILLKSRELMALMQEAPHDFVLSHRPADLLRLLHFKHRTFNATDILYLVEFLHHHYSQHESLQTAFTTGMQEHDLSTEPALNGFYQTVFQLEHAPAHTRKHIASPAKGSTCKRLNMFLRWMVRKDDRGVDFGIWKEISPAQLVCPIDVHVARVAARFGLLTRKQLDWQAALELTASLRELDPDDPVKYDYALFGLGAEERF